MDDIVVITKHKSNHNNDDWILIDYYEKEQHNLVTDIIKYIKNSFIFEFVSEVISIPFTIS